MKNRLLLLVCALVIAEPVAAQNRTKLLTPADFPQRVAAATPAALPQMPKVKRVRSDAADEALKGEVKSVINWSYEAKRKEVSEEKYFDEDGYLTKTVSYLEGYPESVSVWGWIDGMRVLRRGDIAYADGEKPAPSGMILTVRAEDNAIDRNRPRDGRYQMRYEYVYDSQGRLIEDRLFQNNGEIWTRSTYTYEGSRRLERDFGNTGDEHSKTAETFDASGNVIRREMYDENDEVISPEVVSYEFDDHGNWTKKITYEEKTVGKRKVHKLLWTSYRTIKYYA